MKRDYKTGVKGITTEPIFFTGKEVEHTPAYGLKTLFVVDKQDATEIVEYARGYECSHVYLGANHSFNGVDLKKWQKMIDTIIDEPMWCTLDFDYTYFRDIRKWIARWDKNTWFIPTISIKLPHITEMNYNTMIKLDDINFKATNPGIWSHSMNDLMQTKKFTHWGDYGQDEIIDEVNIRKEK